MATVGQVISGQRSSVCEKARQMQLRSGFSPAFWWASAILITMTLATLTVSALGWSDNVMVMWSIFLVITVLVHEFGHAFQSKLRGHEIKEPAVLWLYVNVRQILMLGLGLALLSALVDLGILLFMMGTTLWFHPGAAGFVLSMGSKMAWQFLTAPPCPPLALLAALGGLAIWRPKSTILNWKLKLPLGVGMHTTHHYRDWSDIVAGVTCESAVWLLFGVYLFPVMLWMVPLTILVNIVIPFKLRGEGNDAVCLWREQFARMRGYTGITEV